MAATFLQQAGNGTAQTTYTFSSQNLGAAASGRYILVGVGWRQASSAPTLNSVTVGGVSATEIINLKSGTTSATGSAIFLVPVPTGTTGDVVITFSANSASCGIALYRLVGLTSAAAFDTDSSTAAPRSCTIDIPAGGFAVAIDYNNYGGASITTFVGVDEDYDIDVISNAHHFAGASKSFLAAQTGLSITSTWSTDDGATTGRAMVVASFDLGTVVAADAVSVVGSTPAPIITGIANIAAGVVSAAMSVVAPVATGGANIAADVVSAALNVFGVTVKGFWKNQDKNSATFTNATKNTISPTNQDKNYTEADI